MNLSILISTVSNVPAKYQYLMHSFNVSQNKAALKHSFPQYCEVIQRSSRLVLPSSPSFWAVVGFIKSPSLTESLVFLNCRSLYTAVCWIRGSES